VPSEVLNNIKRTFGKGTLWGSVDNLQVFHWGLEGGRTILNHFPRTLGSWEIITSKRGCKMFICK
jgi:hypothetical protein